MTPIAGVFKKPYRIFSAHIKLLLSYCYYINITPRLFNKNTGSEHQNREITFTAIDKVRIVGINEL